MKYTTRRAKTEFDIYDNYLTEEQREASRNQPWVRLNAQGKVVWVCPQICFKKAISLDEELRRLRRKHRPRIKFKYL